MSDTGIAADSQFVTERLHVGPWHVVADETGRRLDDIVAEMLTARSTETLPPSWQGEFSTDRAKAWIAERDAESPTLLAVDTSSQRPVGLVMLFEDPINESEVDLRIGYVIAEEEWGRGVASELVSGLVDWARHQRGVHSLTGGVDSGNLGSVRVLEKNGFRQLSGEVEDHVTYRLELE